MPEYCFIVYLDGEYKEKDFNIEFCEAVERFGNETDTIKFKEIPSVEAVSVMNYKILIKCNFNFNIIYR